jgi:hypothetical protein
MNILIRVCRKYYFVVWCFHSYIPRVAIVAHDLNDMNIKY